MNELILLLMRFPGYVETHGRASLRCPEHQSQIKCNFAASYLQVLFNGPRRVWGCGAKMVKIEVPLSLPHSQKKHPDMKKSNVFILLAAAILMVACAGCNRIKDCGYSGRVTVSAGQPNFPVSISVSRML
jgi:hypothetical protein